MAVDREALFASRLPEADVEISGVGTVRVRALSRAEVLGLQKKVGDGADRTARLERETIALAMVDPSLTVMEVQRWQEASPAGELEPVTDAIQELSGMKPTAEKEAMLDFRGEPGSGVRALPGGEAEHDGGDDPADG